MNCELLQKLENSGSLYGMKEVVSVFVICGERIEVRLIDGVDQVEGLILVSQVGKGLVDEAYQAENHMEMMEEQA